MNFKQRISVLTLLVSASVNLGAETAAPPESAVCTACHGEGGVSVNPMVPTLAGQPYTLIEDNLLAFRAGRRTCSPERADGSPESLLAQSMCIIVAELEDHQITALAEYFERQAYVPATQNYEKGLVATGAEIHQKNNCELCHSDGGRTTNAMAPVLAGQWTPYLRRTIHSLKNGSRKGPVAMNTAIGALENTEVEALLNYYASQGQAD